jgi:hypothetical protein
VLSAASTYQWTYKYKKNTKKTSMQPNPGTDPQTSA